jgi:hypothetical protein
MDLDLLGDADQHLVLRLLWSAATATGRRSIGKTARNGLSKKVRRDSAAAISLRGSGLRRNNAAGNQGGAP